MKKTVLCLFGGKSGEYKVSLRSVESVLKNIDRERYNVMVAGITKDGEWYLFGGDTDEIVSDTWWQKPEKLRKIILDPSFTGCGFYTLDKDTNVPCELHVDVVFPVMHGQYSEDGTLQGMLSLAGIPYVGCGCKSSSASMDKSITKAVLSGYDVPMAGSLTLRSSDIKGGLDGAVSKIEERFGYPVFIKPASSGSSLGAGRADGKDELIKALSLAFEIDSVVLAEECIIGREVEIAALETPEGEVFLSCCGEIDPGDGFYDYDTKYENDNASYFIPARITEKTYSRICDIAKTVFTNLSCRGMSRIDFFVVGRGEDERVIFNEINTLPGFTSISMYPQLMEKSGIPYKELITRLIEGAGV